MCGRRTSPKLSNISGEVFSDIPFSGNYARNASEVHNATQLLNYQLILTAESVFDIQHYIAIAQASYGLGLATSSGAGEVYSAISIEQIG